MAGFPPVYQIYRKVKKFGSKGLRPRLLVPEKFLLIDPEAMTPAINLAISNGNSSEARSLGSVKGGTEQRKLITTAVFGERKRLISAFVRGLGGISNSRITSS